MLTLRNYLKMNLFYKTIKNFKFKSDLHNFQTFCDFSKEYSVLSNYIISIKKDNEFPK